MQINDMNLSRKLFAEFLGTAGLLAAVVGSGIMGERLAGGNAAIALLANSIATGAALVFLIYGFAKLSGAHINPVVTLAEVFGGRLDVRTGIFYSASQIAGGILGVVTANLMFALPAVNFSTKVRSGPGQYLGEFVATFGLIGVIRLSVRSYPQLVGVMVACYITAAYWFTSSTSFANPAVTLARSLSNTFAGIAPESIPMFLVSQLAGAAAAIIVFNWLLAPEETI